MSNQGDDGWYPECSKCGCGNLGCDVVCSRCHKEIVSKLKKTIRKLKSKGKNGRI